VNDYRDPAGYWEERLTRHFDLCGVGYATLGPIYNAELYQARVRALLRALAASGSRLTDQRVLEIGCGTGFYTELCRQQGVASYVGVDLTAISVNSLRTRYPAWQFVQADVGADDFPLEGPFDVVLLADVLFHIVDPLRFQRALDHVAGCLRPGGHVILSDVLSIASVQSAAHVSLRSHTEYTRVLASCGLDVQWTEPIFGILHPPASVPGTSAAWRAYARLWRHGLSRVAGRSWFDVSVPTLLSWLDAQLFLPRCGATTPNSKWLVATKRA
jgi:SAM-dependent methyltransferase